MKIILELSDEEAERQIECEDENIRPAWKQIIREVEDILCNHQIQYKGIEITQGERHE